MKQVTEEEAIILYQSDFYETLSYDEIVKFQLFQERLSMPFNTFHKAMEQVLQRLIWTHEFADNERLKKEYLKEKDKPTMDEIINMIPKEKRILIKFL